MKGRRHKGENIKFDYMKNKFLKGLIEMTMWEKPLLCI